MSISRLIVFAALAGLAGSAWADTMDSSGPRGESAYGRFGEGRTGEAVLVARDYLPWNGDVVPAFVAAGAVVDVVPTADLATADLGAYCLVFISAGMTQAGEPTASAIQDAMPAVTSYVLNGGDLVFFSGSWGATYTLPGGLTTFAFSADWNAIDETHPIAAGMPDPFEGIAASHDIFFDLPDSATMITTELDGGNPTGVEYDLGLGHCLVMSHPIECYLGAGVCGEIEYPHMGLLFANTVTYALANADCGGGAVEALETPSAFELLGGFPNPFNPSTTIAFSLRTTAAAELAVWNLAGERVATLVDGLVEAGRHEVRFDAAGLPSGVYFARLEALGRSDVQRLLLVK